jgi:cytochrome c peroxidase
MSTYCLTADTSDYYCHNCPKCTELLTEAPFNRKRKAEELTTPVKLTPSEPPTGAPMKPKKAKRQTWTVKCPTCKKNRVEIEYDPVMSGCRHPSCSTCHEEAVKNSEEHEKAMEEFKKKYDDNTPVTIQESWDMFKTFAGKSRDDNWIISCDEVNDFLGVETG